MMPHNTIKTLQQRRVDSDRVTLKTPRKDLSFSTDLVHKVAESFVDHPNGFVLLPRRLPLIGEHLDMHSYSGYPREVYGYVLHGDEQHLSFSILAWDRFFATQLWELPLDQIRAALMQAPIEKGPGMTETALKLLALMDQLYMPPSKPRALGGLVDALRRHRRVFSLYFTPSGIVAMSGTVKLVVVKGFLRSLSIEAAADLTAFH